MGFEPAIAIRCNPGGAIVDVLLDELGLKPRFLPGRYLTSIVEPGSSEAVARLLREIRENGLAEEIPVRIGLGNDVLPLLFLGYYADPGINLIGARKPLTRKDLLRALARFADRGPDVRQAPGSSASRATELSERVVLALTAHDLRNHLNGILAASQYLLADAARLLEAEHVTLLQSIESSGRALYKLVDNILDASAIESEGIKLELLPTDVVALIHQKLSISRIYADRKQVRMELVSSSPVPLIMTDPARINWVIDTLLSNCIESSSPGGRVELSVAAKDERVMISLWIEHGGRSAEDLSRVLDFQRRGTKGIKGGTVLAFQIIKRIMEEHRGTIHVEGNAHTGLTITLVLLFSGQSPVRARSQPG